MKICHVITGLGTGGAQAALYRLVQTLRPPEFEHVVITLGAEDSMSAMFADAAELHHLAMHRGRLLPHGANQHACGARIEVVQTGDVTRHQVDGGWRNQEPER